MNKNFKINYLSRDFSSIREDLKEYAKRYYPQQIKDLSEASLNSFLIDGVSYVGDILSYYLDFQANESFLATALQTENVEKLAKSMGYKTFSTSTTSGKVAVYVLIPSDGNGSVDYTKAPIIKKGTVLRTQEGASTFLINEDVVIDANLIGQNYTVARTNELGNPTFFVVKTYAPIVSGQIRNLSVNVTNFVKFNKIFVGDPLLTEIISVIDSDNNEYYEVPNLSQNIVYKSYLNTDTLDSSIRYSLKPIHAQRRFVLDFENGLPYLLFGNKEYDPNDNLEINPIAEPQKFILQKYNNDFLSSANFEPNSLLSNESFGFGPSSTTLTISYRANTNAASNAAIGEINVISQLFYEFPKAVGLDEATEGQIISSLQIVNEEPIVGNDVVQDFVEIKDLAGNLFQAQGRAVTARDYETLCYAMPKKFGTIKRVKVEKDSDSLKNNINLFVISTDAFGKLEKTNYKVKENLKNWLLDYKIITDSIDILDAKTINFQINFEILVDPKFNKSDVYLEAKNALATFFSFKPQIGENFNILDIYRELRKIPAILDVLNVTPTNITSAGYSSIPFNIEKNYSNDKKIIIIPKNAIYEIRYPNTDIIGNAK